jgi:hypothetical protein
MHYIVVGCALALSTFSTAEADRAKHRYSWSSRDQFLYANPGRPTPEDELSTQRAARPLTAPERDGPGDSANGA